MLRQLDIQNIVLIEKLSLSFGEGLQLFTGETGSGKSILLDALGLALGGRAEARLVRHGAQQAMVSALFDAPNQPETRQWLAEQGIMIEDDALLLRRHLDASGKSRAFINDVPVGLTLLRELGQALLEINGQHDQRMLTDARVHRQLLDGFAGHAELLTRLRERWKHWQKIQQQLAEAVARKHQLEEEKTYLSHVLKELETLAPEAGEEETLAEQRRQMMLAEKRSQSLHEALEALEQPRPLAQLLMGAERILARRVEEDAALLPIVTALEQASLFLAEAHEGLERLLRDSGVDAKLLEQVEARLFDMRAAARKHQCTVDELPAKLQHFKEQLEQLETLDAQCELLEQQVKEAEAAYRQLATDLSTKRASTATKLEAAVMAELPPLNMASARFRAALRPLPEASADGLEAVEFLIAANAGQPEGAISKVASGGELSRLMLALKLALADVEDVPSMVFDEIDTGVGGATAEAIGKRLARLSEKRQVFVVTHQPQVAAFAEKHFSVAKQSEHGQTVTSVTPLNSDERREELARMLSGAAITDQARSAADALLNVAG